MTNNSIKTNKIPSLRFSEFNDEWKIVKLEDISKSIQSGKDKFSNSGQYKLYGSTGKIGFLKNASFKGTYILIARVGANAGKLSVVSGSFGVTDNTLVLNLKNEINKLFIYYYLLQFNLNKLVFGSGQPLITGGQLKSLNITIATTKEQKKIASFLTSVDNKIEQLTKKKKLLKEYKKGVIQKIFNQEMKFKDDNGGKYPKWEEKKLGSIFKRVTRKNIENNQNVLTISAKQGLINQKEYFNKSVAAKNVTGYYLLNKNEFAYNKSYSKGYPMGAIKLMNKYKKGVVSTLYICFKLDDEKSSASFFEQYFESGQLNHEIYKIAQEGARNHGLLNMSVVDFFETIKVKVSSLDEQKKIASFLSEVDSKITRTNGLLDQATKFKKGLLQQMFV